MMGTYDQLIRAQCRPLAPLPTGQPTRVQPLPGIRAVLFDIYGTLLISASGDLACNRPEAEGESIVAALRSVGLSAPARGEGIARVRREYIDEDHRRLKAAGVEYPEIDILSVWRRTLWHERMLKAATGRESLDLARLAIEYELRVNPVWPMPQSEACLTALQRSRRTLGIVSNAQFLTREIWQALLPSADGLFDQKLQFYSYQHGQAKPGTFLFEQAVEALNRRGIPPEAVLYVGNDMLNDIFPARAVGFHTALFAGDARSLRLRPDDPRVAGVAPDLIVNDLLEIPSCLPG